MKPQIATSLSVCSAPVAQGPRGPTEKYYALSTAIFLQWDEPCCFRLKDCKEMHG